MLTFKDYLIEAERSPEDVANLIIGQCLPFINAVGDLEPSTTLFRGTTSAVKDFETRMRQVGKGLSANYQKDIAVTINNYLNRKCSGLSLNNLIYTINDPSEAANYGSPFVVFPVGDFSYAWSRSGKAMSDIIGKGSIEETTQALEAANFICGRCDDDSEDGMEDEGFKRGIASGREVLISAKGYLPISLQYWRQNGQQVMEEISMARM